MIEQSKILFTGGSGLLGSEIRKYLPDVHYPSSSEFNVANFKQMDGFLKKLDIQLLLKKGI